MQALHTLFGGGRLRGAPWDQPEPEHAEIFGVERLEQHGRELARAGTRTSPGRGRSLARRVRANTAALRRDYAEIAGPPGRPRLATPAAEWFFDNYYVIERELRLIRNDLPENYYRQLPKLRSGRWAGFPRITMLAWEFSTHTDSAFSAEALERFLQAYQREQVLTIGELWAFASMLRIVLVEKLRRCADDIVSGRRQREAADAIADRLLGSPTRAAEPLEQVIGRGVEEPLPTTWVVQLVRRLREGETAGAAGSRWIEMRLRAEGRNAEALVREEVQRQSAANVTVRNIVTSLVNLAELDWSQLVEILSSVDNALRTGSAFGAMDFATRNRYRTAVEQIARGARRSELEVAQAAVAASRERSGAAGGAGAAARRDPGYWLIGPGRREFEKELGVRVAAGTRVERGLRAMGLPGYLGLFVLAMVAVLGEAAAALAAVPPLSRTAMLVMFALPLSEVILALLNSAYTRVLRPEVLPAIDLAAGVPESARTLVVMPVLLTSVHDVEELVGRLEAHYLSSAPGELYFALLADVTDAAAAEVPEDVDVLAAGRQGIERLNARHGPGSAGPRFQWLSRKRLWNPAQGCWMGWERKRGKLHELNRLLRGARDTSFESAAAVPDVRFVLVLDADTRLAPGAAEKLIGKLSHPLNRPEFDPVTQRVTAGYGIMQPRVTPALATAAGRSLLEQALSGEPGLDPYAFAVSDLYQDLCGEGSFTGKGLYDVDAFERALAGRIAENTILSHDLLEGLFARAALATDVEVIEPSPDRYDVAAAREHRWVRGDWQLLPWLFGRRSRPLRLIDRWKIFDNLRRSLVAPASLDALALGWTLPLPMAASWSALLIGLLGITPLWPVWLAARDRPRHLTRPSGRRALRDQVQLALLHWSLAFVLLADRAWRMADAITRTLVRVVITHRHLLDWTSAAQTRRASRLEILSYARFMAGGMVWAWLVAALAAFSAVIARGPAAAATVAAVAAPWVLLWMLAPWLALRISTLLPVTAGGALGTDDAPALRAVARRTWRFFEHFVTAADQHLPPDNFQETPRPVVAHRTSPTNIGLYLLSSVCAYEWGWIGLCDWVERLEASFATLRKLERHRGHFYNWYDTQTLAPLRPAYVSTVDSGNLAGHLITLANALEAALRRPLWSERRLEGVRDALALAESELPEGGAAVARFAAAVRNAAPEASAVAAQIRSIVPLVDANLYAEAARATDGGVWLQAAASCVVSHARDLEEQLPEAAWKALQQRIAALATSARRLVEEMDFRFLLDPQRLLLAIGYRVAEGRLDTNYYDLLASEARLASMVAVAKRDAPARHWFRLGRSLVPVDDTAALVSWSGSMFEYLMPALVMAEPPESLLRQSHQAVVRCQREYVATRGLPWGISESAYSLRDMEQTYQYSTFGVPALGLKRGLEEDAVIAPYATGLASMIDPAAAAANFAALRALGAEGAFGFYEAADFTPSRLAAGERFALVRTYMAHHQGMTIVALANTLLDGVLREYFHAEPAIRACEVLLQEKPPRDVEVPVVSTLEEAPQVRLAALPGPQRRRVDTWRPRTPQAQRLSNGRYSVVMNAAGGSASAWGDLAVTRATEDPLRDGCSAAIYLRERGPESGVSGAPWSAGFHPTGSVPEQYRVLFSEDRVEIARRDGPLATTLEVLVSTEFDAEARRVTISNQGTRTREIELTSYAELVLTTAAADRAHRAFSNLFIETEYVASLEALLAGRRARAAGEIPLWAVHLALVEGEDAGPIEYETDRAKFLGRGRSIARPRALADRAALEGTVGTVLDPVFSLRRAVRIERGATARVTFWTGVAPTREAALQLAERCRDVAAFGRATTLAWTHAQVQLHHLGIDPEEASRFQRLAAHIGCLNPALRPAAESLSANTADLTALWALGISGDLPLVVIELDDLEQLELARQLARAHHYWEQQNLAVDLVLINGMATSYVQELQAALDTLARPAGPAAEAPSLSSVAGAPPFRRGAIFALHADRVTTASRAALASAARIVLVARRGSLAEQLDRLESAAPEPELPTAWRGRGRASALHVARAADSAEPGRAPDPPIELFNGTGGFTAGGEEYAIALTPSSSTPLPWINVIAQPQFGFQVSAEGAGFTWSGNSREHALTAWSNDAVLDPPSEAFYVRDEETGEFWSPTASPIREPHGHYLARHGQGYSVFEYESRGMALELIQFVPSGASFKISRLRVRNRSGRTRRLAVCAYVEWTLGPSRATTLPYLVTARCAETGAWLARNPWNAAFAADIAFLDVSGPGESAAITGTTDRREFLGLQGGLEAPAALRKPGAWSMRAGGGLDACAAWLTPVDVAPGATGEVVARLGNAAGAAAVAPLIREARALDVERALGELRGEWDALLGTVQVTTPDRSFDLLLNRWLVYQTLSCRMWARAAFYQAGGAYGFRDQLQDALALTVAAPGITRAHLLRAAGRQFPEGDVQHWWMPESGRGVRTRISDDRVWLAYCAAHYVRTTGDRAVLDEPVPFLSGPALADGAVDDYFQPGTSATRVSVFEHCALALDASLALGAHGLPLIGTGDWNDGFNAVGAGGRGESVWLGWFLCATLEAFGPLAAARGEAARVARWQAHVAALRGALEQAGWDGDWYRRGYFDDGTALGSAANSECRIDSIAQSWAVLSGAANPPRAAHAMAAVAEGLGRPDERLALLFTPPFAHANPDPGYIKAYPAGVRENGGQYTHAGVWAVMAFAELGDGERAKQWFDWLSPLHHTEDPAAVERYQLEPYVVAADIYAAADRVGRGGWSWYTGSAGWLYRAGLESILGFKLEGEVLRLEPCVPRAWRRFEIAFRFRSARYRISVNNPFGVSSGVNHAEVDHLTILRAPLRLNLVDDGAQHEVRVVMG
jgi:cyclic beta-1,2-glucan synthetase